MKFIKASERMPGWGYVFIRVGEVKMIAEKTKDELFFIDQSGENKIALDRVEWLDEGSDSTPAISDAVEFGNFLTMYMPMDFRGEMMWKDLRGRKIFKTKELYEGDFKDRKKPLPPLPKTDKP